MPPLAVCPTVKLGGPRPSPPGTQPSPAEPVLTGPLVPTCRGFRRPLGIFGCHFTSEGHFHSPALHSRPEPKGNPASLRP